MVDAADEKIRQLIEPMVRKRLYVVLSKPTGAPEAIKATTPAHLEYMIGLEQRGILFASGPFLGSDGKPAGDGMTILRTASAEEAKRIAEADPFFAKGLRRFEVREWMLMEGSLGLTVTFSNQAVALA